VRPSAVTKLSGWSNMDQKLQTNLSEHRRKILDHSAAIR
jgi:hypothetical protein